MRANAAADRPLAARSAKIRSLSSFEYIRTSFIEVQESAALPFYPGYVKAAKKITSFIGQFDIDSAARAIFCINSWHENRSSQSSTYALNAALLDINDFGTKPILDYESFSAFFSHIKKTLPKPPITEDEVVPAMGQTLIPFQGRWHRALYGCGDTLEYPRLCFADTILDDQNRIAEFNELLDYVDAMSKKLGGGGWQNSDSVPGDMRLPSCDYWNRTCRWIEADPTRYRSANTIAAIDESTSYVENKCFRMNSGKAILLFCPSILEDYLARSMAGRNMEGAVHDLDGYAIVFTSNAPKEEVREKFSPELLSRFSLKARFAPLSTEDKQAFVRRYIENAATKYQRTRNTLPHPDDVANAVLEGIDVSKEENIRVLKNEARKWFVDYINECADL